MIPAPALELPRHHLRPLQAADLPAWAAYLRLPQVHEHTSWDIAGPADLADQLSDPGVPPGEGPFRLAIVRRDDGALVGTAGFHTWSTRHRSAELAYDLAPEAWGQGLARAVVAALVRWAHGPAGLQRVQATVLTSNQRSIRVLEHCGFQREGLLRAFRQVRGRPGDFWMFAQVRVADRGPAGDAPP